MEWIQQKIEIKAIKIKFVPCFSFTRNHDMTEIFLLHDKRLSSEKCSNENNE